MRYISLLIGSLLMLFACNEVKVDDNGGVNPSESSITTGFNESEISVFENDGSKKVYIDFSKKLSFSTQLRVEICEESNIYEDKNYFIVSKILDVNAGEQGVELDFSLVDDNIVNGDRNFSIQIMSANSLLIDTLRSKMKIIVLDDESDIAIGFKEIMIDCREKELASVVESYRLNIPIELKGKLTKPIEFEVLVYSLDDANQAIEGAHFKLPQSVFVVEQGDAELSIPVEILDDQIVNANRVFSIEIARVSGGEIYTPQKRCLLTIKNDDMGIYFDKTDIVVEEGSGLIKIPVKLTELAEVDQEFTLSLGGTATVGSDYSMSTTWTIPMGKDSVEIEIDIKDVLGTNPNRNLLLDFNLLPSGIQVFELGKRCELDILDCDKELTFDKESFAVSNDSMKMILPLTLSEAVEHDISFRVDIAGLVGLSEEQVTVVNPEITIPAGSVKANVFLNLKVVTPARTKANVSLKITDVYGASSSKACTKLHKFYKYTNEKGAGKKYFTLESYSSVHPARPANAAIDGDLATFWHSVWNGTVSVIPEGLVIGLEDGMHGVAIEVVRRSSNPNAQRMEVYTSGTETKFVKDDDGTKWGASIGTVDWGNPSPNYAKFSTVCDKYLKLSVTKSNDGGNAQIAEVSVYAYFE